MEYKFFDKFTDVWHDKGTGKSMEFRVFFKNLHNCTLLPKGHESSIRQPTLASEHLISS